VDESAYRDGARPGPIRSLEPRQIARFVHADVEDRAGTHPISLHLWEGRTETSGASGQIAASRALGVKALAAGDLAHRVAGTGRRRGTGRFKRDQALQTFGAGAVGGILMAAVGVISRNQRRSALRHSFIERCRIGGLGEGGNGQDAANLGGGFCLGVGRGF